MEPSDDPLQAAESADTPASPSANPVPPSPPVSEAEPAQGSPIESATPPEVEAVSEAQPAPVPKTAATVPDPVIASTVTIPAQENSTDVGGEWDLLVEKIKAWIDSKELGSVWSQAQLPLRLIGGLILFVIVISVYGGFLCQINKVPLEHGLMEVTGLIWLLNYARCNLVRSSDRK